MERMGSLAAEWILDALREPRQASAEVSSSTRELLNLFPAELVVRDSTAAPAAVSRTAKRREKVFS
jgi:hypothetical protein